MTATTAGDHGEDRDLGFTFVELVISLTLIAVGVVALMGVMNSSFGVVVKTNHRSRAIALATKELEMLRAVPYEQLATSTVPSVRPEAVDGQAFTVERAVTWSPDAITRHYKRGTVAVTWTDAAGTHSVAQSTFYYPGGLGAAVPAASTSCAGSPAAPTALSATAAGTGDDPAVDLAWQPATSSQSAVAKWVIQRSTDAFATVQLVSDSVPPSATSYRVVGLTPSTVYWFRVAAVDTCGQRSEWSPTAGTTTLSPSTSQCELGVPNVTPAQVRLTSGSSSAGLNATPQVTISATSSCTGFSLRYKPTASTTRTAAFTSSTGAITATVDPRGPWEVGVRELEVLTSSGTRTATLLLTVCTHNASTCR